MCNGKCGGCVVHKICKVLLVIGGLNWGLVGITMLMGNGTNLNVVNLLLGSWPTAEAIVYVIVGLAALGSIFGCKCKKCMEACATCQSGNMSGGMDKNM